MTFCGHHQWEQQAPDAAVAISKRMHRFKMRMRYCHSYNEALVLRLHSFASHVAHRLFEACSYVLWRRGIVCRIRDVSAADPDDTAAEFSGHVFVVAIAGHYFFVQLL